jgi:thymidine phosphorylase
VDPAAGVELLAKVGDEVEQGQPLARLHVGRPDRVEEAKRLIEEAYTIGPNRPESARLILDRVRLKNYGRQP